MSRLGSQLHAWQAQQFSSAATLENEAGFTFCRPPLAEVATNHGRYRGWACNRSSLFKNESVSRESCVGSHSLEDNLQQRLNSETLGRAENVLT